MIKNTVAKHFSKVADKLCELDFSDKAVYAEWLAQTYFFVKHSTKMVALSAAFTKDYEFQKRAYKHLAEEKGHDILLLNDLKALGYNINQFQEFNSTRAFWQAQYYWIEHEHPASYYGYVMVLEELAARIGGGLYKTAVKSHGDRTGSFLKVHSEDDVDHIEEAYKMVDALPKDAQQAIDVNYAQAADGYLAIIEDIKSKVCPGSKAA